MEVGLLIMRLVVGLTLAVAVEKLAPRGQIFGRAVGVALIGWGLAKLAGL